VAVDYSPWIDADHFTSTTNSVDGDEEIDWAWQSGSSQTYDSLVEQAASVWNALDVGGAGVSIHERTGEDVDLEFAVVKLDDVDWAGIWTALTDPDLIRLNYAHMDNYSADVKQNVVTHEMGHALLGGTIAHSFWGNIMFESATTKTTSGPQDIVEYKYCWIDNNC
jgi:hypothetical protein